MQARARCLLFAVTIAAAGAPRAQAAVSDPLEWETATKDGITVEKPRGWEWKVEDDGNTLWFLHGEVDGEHHVGPVALIARRRLDNDDDDASTLARLYMERHQLKNAKLAFSVDGTHYSAVLAYDSYRGRPMRIAVRVEVAPATRVATVLFIRCPERFFRDYRGWEVLDRIYVSLGKGGLAVSSHRKWRWATMLAGGVALDMPEGWAGKWKDLEDDGFTVSAHGGDGNGKYRAFFARVRRTGNDVDAGEFERRLVSQTYPTVNLLNPGSERDGPTIYGDAELRVAARTRVQRDFFIISLAATTPRAFWSAEIPAFAQQLEGGIGIAPSGLRGAWLSGEMDDIGLHYEGAPNYIAPTAENTLLIAFYRDGTYEFRYLHSKRLQSLTKTKVFSEEVGHYTFDGYILELTPTRRTITYERSKHQTVLRAKQLGTLQLRVQQVVDTPGLIYVNGPSFSYVGLPPSLQKVYPGRSGFTMRPVALGKIPTSFGLRKRDQAAKRNRGKDADRAKQRDDAKPGGRAKKKGGFKAHADQR